MSEVVLSVPVQATRTVHIDEAAATTPGAFEYYIAYGDPPDAKPRGMIYICPCGCGHQGSLSFKPPSADDVKYGRATWEWDGNLETPTLAPSVHHVGHWHGYLRAGMWVQA